MNKERFFLILQREYLEIVAKKSFIVMTILTPFLIVLLGAIPVVLDKLNTSEVQTVAVIDETGKYANDFKSDNEYRFEIIDQNVEGNPRQLQESRGDELYAIVLLPRNIEKNHQVLVYSQQQISAHLERYIEDALNDVLTDAKIASYGIDGLDKILKECNVNVDVRTIKWGEDGSAEFSSADLAMGIGIMLALISYMFVLMYGAMIMNSVIEEKTNRIVEVIVSSVKPLELMLGKIVGVALVGLTQLAIWSVLLGVIGAIAGVGAATAIDPASLGSAQDTATAAMAEASNPENFIAMLSGVNFTQILVFFVIYSIGGYLLYASIFAGLGSAVDQASEASQFTTPVMIVIVIALYSAIACMENPSGDIAFWCSIIPFTSPIVMMVRLPYDVPAWQMILSIALLYATAIGFTVLAGKIYRTGILLYGKKNSYKDIIKWLK